MVSTEGGTFPNVVFPAGCPSRTLMDHVTSKWGLLVLLALGEGHGAGEPLRWSELRRRADGVSEKMLAQTLRVLVGDGLVLRDARPVVPPHVEYSLTTSGRELVDLLNPVMAWAVQNAPAILEDAATS